MALPTLNTFTANTKIESSKVNENFTNLRNITEVSSSTDHIVITAGTSKLVKITVLRQDNTTDTYTANSVILTGWGFVAGSGTANATETVTFGITFGERPVVVGSTAGYKVSSDPSHIGDTGGNAVGTTTLGATATTGLTMYYSQGNPFDSTVRVLYSWIAVGALT
jgi:hypothetical protein